MKIRDRLALFFTLLAAGILLLYSIFFYFILTHHGIYPEAGIPDQTGWWLLACFLMSLPLIYAVGRFSAGKILRPISRRIQEANQISTSKLHLRLSAPHEKDETGQLSLTFNSMLDRLEASFQIQKNFISNASHEIRNPLTAIIGETEVCLARKRTAVEYIDSLNNILREAERLESLVSSLLSLATTEFDETSLKLEETRLDEVILDAKALVDKSYPQNQIKLLFSALPQQAELLSIEGNANLLRIALINLMENACKFSANAEVLVKISHSGKRLRLSIEDKGVGIPRQELQNIFQPFYRARNARSYKGYGIGLSLTEKIIRLHKGEINIFSEESKGTTIEISFPTSVD